MGEELIAILGMIVGTGIALAALISPQLKDIRKDVGGLQQSVGDLRERMARLEGRVDTLVGVVDTLVGVVIDPASVRGRQPERPGGLGGSPSP